MMGFPPLSSFVCSLSIFIRDFNCHTATFYKYIHTVPIPPSTSNQISSIMASSGRTTAVTGGSGSVGTPANNVGGDASARRVSL
jgi:hypothetical protein